MSQRKARRKRWFCLCTERQEQVMDFSLIGVSRSLALPLGKTFVSQHIVESLYWKGFLSKLVKFYTSRDFMHDDAEHLRQYKVRKLLLTVEKRKLDLRVGPAHLRYRNSSRSVSQLHLHFRRNQSDAETIVRFDYPLP